MYQVFDKDGKEVLFDHSIDAVQAVKMGVCFMRKPEKNTKGPVVKKEEEKKEEKKVVQLPLPEEKKIEDSIPKRGPKKSK